MSVNAITSPEAFLATLDIDDRFWNLESNHGKGPDEIAGPFVIISIDPHRRTVVVQNPHGDEMTKFIGDLTNKWHGVTTSEADAQAYLAERMELFATDPELIRELADTREFWDSLSEDDDYPW